MKTLLALLLSCFCSLGAVVSLGWTPGDNPGGTHHLIYWGVSAGVYTNSISIPYAQTTCTVSNLQAGVRYYFCVKETDGVDFSDWSNEVNTKTKMNPAKNLSFTP